MQKGVSAAAKSTRNQLANAAPTGERINSKDEVEATLEFQPSDLIRRTFPMDAQPDGQKLRATMVEATTQHQQDHANQPELVKFRISVNDDQYEEIVTVL